MKQKAFIFSVDLQLLHNLEFYSFVENILNSLNEVNQELDFRKETAQIRKGLAQFDMIFEKKKLIAYTQKVNELDKKRCASFTGLLQCVRGYTKHFKKDVREAAQVILESIESMGSKIVYLNYQVKSATFSSLCSSWQDIPEFAEAFETLAMSDWIKHLNEDNKAFEAAYLERLSAQASAPKAKLIDLRAELIKQYRVSVKKLEAYCLLEKDGAMELCNRFNKLIAAYNKEIVRRKNKLAKES
ncbi:DUF6261 family protein [Marinifilum sp.]|uniref:DUF6261 family protein n=1 Tax=Marinifilum sp. TaxID=2033137 RepID=UPI003BA9AAA0